MIEYIEKEKDNKIRSILMKELRKSFFIFLKFENTEFSRYEKLKKEHMLETKIIVKNIIKNELKKIEDNFKSIDLDVIEYKVKTKFINKYKKDKIRTKELIIEYCRNIKYKLSLLNLNQIAIYNLHRKMAKERYRQLIKDTEDRIVMTRQQQHAKMCKDKVERNYDIIESICQFLQSKEKKLTCINIKNVLIENKQSMSNSTILKYKRLYLKKSLII